MKKILSLLLALAGVQIPFAASSILIAVSVSLETIRTIQGEMGVRGGNCIELVFVGGSFPGLCVLCVLCG